MTTTSNRDFWIALSLTLVAGSGELVVAWLLLRAVSALVRYVG